MKIVGEFGQGTSATLIAVGYRIGRADHACNIIRPGAKSVDVLVGNPQNMRDHGGGQGIGEIPDQVDLGTPFKRFQQIFDNLRKSLFIQVSEK